MYLDSPKHSFLGADVATDTDTVNTPYAFMGVPFGPPYEASDLSVSSGAADAVRDVTHRMGYATEWDHYDFDYGRALFPDGRPTVTDCGNVVANIREPDGISERAVDALLPLARAGKVPLVVGGLDSIPPMVVKAFAGVEEVNILHVDAHLDFRDELSGVRHGYSSPIRRIREMGHVRDIVQVGLRSMGSARPSDVTDATDSGNILVTAWQLHERGVQSFVDALPDSGRFVVTIDCDGLDPSIAPAVGWPEPGGLSYFQIGTIVRALARNNRIAAMLFTEFRPALDPNGTTAQTIARLFMNVIGLQTAPDRGSR